MKKLLVCLLFLGCGKPLVPSRVDVVHQINVDTIDKYVRVYCRDDLKDRLFEDDFAREEAVDTCVDLEIGKLLSKI